MDVAAEPTDLINRRQWIGKIFIRRGPREALSLRGHLVPGAAVMGGRHWSVIGKLVTRHLRSVADEQATMSNDRVVPGLPFDGLKTAQFLLLLGIDGDEYCLTRFGNHNESGWRLDQQPL